MISRKKTRQIKIGDIAIGGDAPISIQSMLSVPTIDVEEALAQIQCLYKAGCDIVRLGVPDKTAAAALKPICKASPLPVVADIHFDYRLALMAVDNGVKGLRLNPGNIRKEAFVREVVVACQSARVPIRIGVNGGSINRKLFPEATPEALVNSALSHIRILEDMGFQDIKVSLKSSHVPTMIEAYRLFSQKRDYPLHLGVTEAGDYVQAVVKSAVGMGVLLNEGIGDTLRVSITGDVVLEVEAARLILRTLGLRQEGVEIISCPTCARKEYDVEATVREFREHTRHIKKYVKVAIMGCVVNGPGEAADADIGVAVGRKDAVLFKKGRMIKKVDKSKILEVLLDETERI